MATLYHTGTEWTSNQVTMIRGTPADILLVGVYHGADPNYIPEEEDFIEVLLVDGTAEPPLHPLAIAGRVDIMALVGSRNAAHVFLDPGDYQRWTLVSTDVEAIIRPVDTIEVK